MKDLACGECVVSMILGPVPSSIGEHEEAISVLADAGLIKPLRLIRGEVEILSDSAIAQ